MPSYRNQIAHQLTGFYMMATLAFNELMLLARRLPGSFKVSVYEIKTLKLN